MLRIVDEMLVDQADTLRFCSAKPVTSLPLPSDLPRRRFVEPCHHLASAVVLPGQVVPSSTLKCPGSKLTGCGGCAHPPHLLDILQFERHGCILLPGVVVMLAGAQGARQCLAGPDRPTGGSSSTGSSAHEFLVVDRLALRLSRCPAVACAARRLAEPLGRSLSSFRRGPQPP